MNWKDKTCEKCKYRCIIRCQRFPPMSGDYYPIVFMKKDNFFFPACAEYKEREK